MATAEEFLSATRPGIPTRPRIKYHVRQSPHFDKRQAHDKKCCNLVEDPESLEETPRTRQFGLRQLDLSLHFEVV